MVFDALQPKQKGWLAISIVIPTLNSEKTLKDCLKSIAEQDYPHNHLEIIIADGGSTIDKGLMESSALRS